MHSQRERSAPATTRAASRGRRGRHRNAEEASPRRSPELRSRDLSAAVLAACLGSGIGVCVLSSAQAGPETASVAAPAAAEVAAGAAVLESSPAPTASPFVTAGSTPTVPPEAGRKTASAAQAAKDAEAARQAAADKAVAVARARAQQEADAAAAAKEARAAADARTEAEAKAARQAAEAAAASPAAEPPVGASPVPAPVRPAPAIVASAPTKPAITSLSCTRGAGGAINASVQFSTGGAPGNLAFDLGGYGQVRQVGSSANSATAYAKGVTGTGCKATLTTGYGSATRTG